MVVARKLCLHAHFPPLPSLELIVELCMLTVIIIGTCILTSILDLLAHLSQTFRETWHIPIRRVTRKATSPMMKHRCTRSKASSPPQPTRPTFSASQRSSVKRFLQSELPTSRADNRISSSSAPWLPRAKRLGTTTSARQMQILTTD